MNPNPQLFSESLEAYVLQIAELVIDCVDEATQADLMRFIYQINSSVTTQISVSGLVVPRSPYTFSEFISDSPGGTVLPDYLDERRQALFRQSVVNHRQVRIAFLQQSLVLRQKQIDSVLRSISTMEDLIERANRLLSVSNLLVHYQSIQGRLKAYLITLQRNHKREVYRVNAILSTKTKS